jgi:hypothetical protein
VLRPVQAPLGSYTPPFPSALTHPAGTTPGTPSPCQRPTPPTPSTHAHGYIQGRRAQSEVVDAMQHQELTTTPPLHTTHTHTHTTGSQGPTHHLLSGLWNGSLLGGRKLDPVPSRVLGSPRSTSSTCMSCSSVPPWRRRRVSKKAAVDLTPTHPHAQPSQVAVSQEAAQKKEGTMVSVCVCVCVCSLPLRPVFDRGVCPHVAHVTGGAPRHC